MKNLLNDINQTTLNNANQLIALNTRVVNKTIKRQTELSDIFASSSKQQMNLLAENPQELVEKQALFTDQYAVIYSEVAKTNLELILKTSAKYKSWFENNTLAVNQEI